jgi:hypothetical protein
MVSFYSSSLNLDTLSLSTACDSSWVVAILLQNNPFSGWGWGKALRSFFNFVQLLFFFFKW